MQAAVQTSQEKYPFFTPIGFTGGPFKDQRTATCIIKRPTAEEVEKTTEFARSIFVNAFTKKYTEYHANAKTTKSIEEWLVLKEGVKFPDWLNATFDEELKEYWAEKKGMIYLTDGQDRLIAWLSHSAVDEKGDVYLSQCSLETALQGKGIVSSAFETVISQDIFQKIFPGVRTLKLIARKVNEVADHLYVNKAGFTRDETIDPSIYGDSYDNRYRGYQRAVG